MTIRQLNTPTKLDFRYHRGRWSRQNFTTDLTMLSVLSSHVEGQCGSIEHSRILGMFARNAAEVATAPARANDRVTTAGNVGCKRDGDANAQASHARCNLLTIVGTRDRCCKLSRGGRL